MCRCCRSGDLTGFHSLGGLLSSAGSTDQRNTLFFTVIITNNIYNKRSHIKQWHMIVALILLHFV